MAWLPYDYWASYEVRVKNIVEFDDCVRLIRQFGERYGEIYETDPETQLHFYWRGQADLLYGLHSSLGRLLDRRNQLTEKAMVNAERAIIDEARTWLADLETASALNVLARLQCFGAPTRLLDFTRNPDMALFFCSGKARFKSRPGCRHRCAPGVGELYTH